MGVSPGCTRAALYNYRGHHLIERESTWSIFLAYRLKNEDDDRETRLNRLNEIALVFCSYPLFVRKMEGNLEDGATDNGWKQLL